MGDGRYSKPKPVSWSIPEDLIAAANAEASSRKMDTKDFIALCIEPNVQDVLPGIIQKKNRTFKAVKFDDGKKK
jgi:hypothetical protein